MAAPRTTNRRLKHVEGTLDAAGHPELYWQAWLPAQSRTRAVVVLAHGASEHGGRYAHVGERLAASKYALYAMDHRGHGRSPGQRGNIERMDGVVSDLHAFIEVVAARHKGAKIFLFGHSMGGMVSIAYALRHQDEIAGLILTGALATLDAGSAAQRLAGRVLSAVAPSLPIIGISPEGVSRDPAVVADYVADPLNYHGKVRARTVGEFVVTVASFPGAVSALTLPMLVMHGTADTLAPPSGSELVHDGASSEDKTLRMWEGLFHELVNEPEQDEVMDEIVRWLDARA